MKRKIKFWVAERENVHVKNGREWALCTKIDGGDAWVIATFEKKLNDETIKSLINLSLRSMEIYHKSIRPMEFNLELD